MYNRFVEEIYCLREEYLFLVTFCQIISHQDVGHKVYGRTFFSLLVSLIKEVYKSVDSHKVFLVAKLWEFISKMKHSLSYDVITALKITKSLWLIIDNFVCFESVKVHLNFKHITHLILFLLPVQPIQACTLKISSVVKSWQKDSNLLLLTNSAFLIWLHFCIKIWQILNLTWTWPKYFSHWPVTL